MFIYYKLCIVFFRCLFSFDLNPLCFSPLSCPFSSHDEGCAISDWTSPSPPSSSSPRPVSLNRRWCSSISSFVLSRLSWSNPAVLTPVPGVVESGTHLAQAQYHPHSTSSGPRTHGIRTVVAKLVTRLGSNEAGEAERTLNPSHSDASSSSSSSSPPLDCSEAAADGGEGSGGTAF
jgi:hypothetical protein